MTFNQEIYFIEANVAALPVYDIVIDLSTYIFR